MKVEDLPKEDRPREKAIKYGISNLSNSELIALLLGNGFKGMNVIELSQNIMSSFNSLSSLASSSYESLAIKGLSQAKILRLLACFEISRRLNSPSIDIPYKYLNKEILTSYFKTLDLSRENVFLLIYSQRGKFLRNKIMYTGTSSNVCFSPPEIISEILKVNGKSFLLIHNHPSGILKPSSVDFETTKNLLDLSKKMNVKFLDHLIISNDSIYSFFNEFCNKKSEKNLAYNQQILDLFN